MLDSLRYLIIIYLIVLGGESLCKDNPLDTNRLDKSSPSLQKLEKEILQELTFLIIVKLMVLIFVIVYTMTNY